MGRGGALASFTIRSRVLLQRQLFSHDNFRTARASGHDVKFVHKCTHKKDSAAGGAQEVFFCKRIRHVGKCEASAFIQDMDDHFVAGKINGEMNFLFGALLIAVVKCVNDALAYAHADLVAIVLAESGSLGYAEAHLFGEIYALDLRLQRDFEVLRVFTHAWRAAGGK